MIIYVSNLGEKVTPDSLEALFATYGKVTSPILIRDEAAVGPARFALVEMMSSTEAVNAISKLHGSIINGCSLNVMQVKNQQAPKIVHLTNYLKLLNHEYRRN